LSQLLVFGQNRLSATNPQESNEEELESIEEELNYEGFEGFEWTNTAPDLTSNEPNNKKKLNFEDGFTEYEDYHMQLSPTYDEEKNTEKFFGEDQDVITYDLDENVEDPLPDDSGKGKTLVNNFFTQNDSKNSEDGKFSQVNYGNTHSSIGQTSDNKINDPTGDRYSQNNNTNSDVKNIKNDTKEKNLNQNENNKSVENKFKEGTNDNIDNFNDLNHWRPRRHSDEAFDQEELLNQINQLKF